MKKGELTKTDDVPNPGYRHAGEPGLGNEGNDTGQPDATLDKLLVHIALPGAKDDKGKGVNEGEHKHGPANPVVPDVELLMRNARERRNHVCLCAQQQHKGQTGEGHPAGAGSNGGRVAIVGVGRPVVRSRAERHGGEEDDADAEEHVGAERLRVVAADAKRLVGEEAHGGDGAAPDAGAGEASGRILGGEAGNGEDGDCGEEEVDCREREDVVGLVPVGCGEYVCFLMCWWC